MQPKAGSLSPKETEKNDDASSCKRDQFPTRYDQPGGGGFPTVICGSDAKLEFLRHHYVPLIVDPVPDIIASLNNGINSDDKYNNTQTEDENQSKNESTNENESNSVEEYIIHHQPIIEVTWTVNNNEEDTINNSLSSDEFRNVSGQLYITSKRIFFVASKKDEYKYDFAIDAACIALHAMSREPKWNVYCQLTEEINNIIWDENTDKINLDKDNSPIEIFFSPLKSPETFCQILFKALTNLATLNPVAAEEDAEEDGEWCGNAMGSFSHSSSGTAMMAMMSGVTGEYYGDEIVYREDDSIDKDDPQQMDRREKMLEKLDNMLVVPSECDTPGNNDSKKTTGNQGQFDDADEDNSKTDTEMDVNISTTTTASKTSSIKPSPPKSVNASGGGQFDDAEDEDDLL